MDTRKMSTIPRHIELKLHRRNIPIFKKLKNKHKIVPKEISLTNNKGDEINYIIERTNDTAKGLRDDSYPILVHDNAL